VVSDTTFEALMSTHRGEIYRYLRRATGRASDADDLAQETFLRAFRAYRNLPPDANARAWLFAIATNLSKNHYRSQSRRRRAYALAAHEATETDLAGAPDRATLSRETAARLEGIVDRLPTKQRLAFIQRKLHGLDYDAIGVSLRCSAESARAHVFQALKKIRLALDAPAMRGEGARS
jgi:RNA polymerase sigma-70 factor (ECF subfamily)